MFNTPPSGFVDPDDWGEFLCELLERNPEVQQSVEKVEQTCRSIYKNLQAKGYPEEDIREILFMTDLAYELENACADATMQIVRENYAEVTMKIGMPEDQTELQRCYLKMLQAKYRTTSGCFWGEPSSPHSQEKENE